MARFGTKFKAKFEIRFGGKFGDKGTVSGGIPSTPSWETQGGNTWQWQDGSDIKSQ